MSEEPSQSQVLRGVERALGVKALRARRFPTGLRHYVFEVQLDDGRAVVARIAGPQAGSAIRSGAHWSRRLRALGAPLPETLYADLDGELLGRPWVILERLPGRDLGDAYPQLDAAQKVQVLDEVCRIQELAARLDAPAGFGRVADPSQARLLPNWAKVVKRLLAFAVATVERNGAAPTEWLQRVERWYQSLEPALEAVTSTVFLEDLTTKNVIVHEGRLAGIVDVDEIVLGDPLLVVALTRVALETHGHDSLYTDLWAERWAASDVARERLELYTAIFCVVLLGEHGQSFNRARATQDEPALQRQLALLRATLGGAAA